MPLRAAVIAIGLLVAQPGCSLVAAGFASENHLGGCMDSAAPGGIDVVLGAMGAAGLVMSGRVDHSTGLLAIPGTFVAIGVTQMIFADRCRERANGSHATYAYLPSPAPPPAPALAPDQRDATPEEMGIVPPRTAPSLALPHDYALPPPPAPPAEEAN